VKTTVVSKVTVGKEEEGNTDEGSEGSEWK
jgi:hypothetical protein